MPSVPKSLKCEALRCTADRLTGSAYCEAHGSRHKASPDRLRSNNEYKLRLWEAIRIRQLSTQPLCQSCLLNQQITPAVAVDHVFNWKAINPEAFRFNLFQSLCISCHSQKTAQEKKGIYIHYDSDQAREYTAQDYSQLMAQLYR